MILRRTLIALAATTLTPGLAVAVAGGPAQAAVPNQWAFAYMNNPVPPMGMLMDITRQWKSDNIPNSTVDPLVLGRYRLKFPGIASGNGVAHVSAVAPDARWCNVFTKYNVGIDLFIEVQCWQHTGMITPAPSAFTIVYSTSSGALAGAGTYAYVRGNLLGGVSASYNPAGMANTSTHAGAGTGTYTVFLPGVSTGFNDGNIQVSAEHPNSPRRCKVIGWTPAAGGHTIVVRCLDEMSVPADSWFNLTYHRDRSIYGALAPPNYFGYFWTPGLPAGTSNFNSTGAMNTMAVAGVGLKYVQFPSVGVSEGNIQITAYQGGASYCNLQNVWGLTGTTVTVNNVICFNAGGAPAASNFFITYSSRT
ncbi:MAG TPA: hypothetical protein VFC19_18965 [Candidatus Limnocylindrales bacterium]|nr:hypothetical protein [Candidatus Limnocylindrales bacterium]